MNVKEMTKVVVPFRRFINVVQEKKKQRIGTEVTTFYSQWTRLMRLRATGYFFPL